MASRRRQRGATLVEMTLVGIPIMFALIATFEVSRGMWIYGTLSYAAREGTRYVIVHGQNCQTSTVPNCAITQTDLGIVLNQAAIGLIPEQLQVTFTSGAPETITCTLDQLMTASCAGASIIPSGTGATVGHFVTVALSYPFYSGFLGSVTLPAYSQDFIRY